MHARTASCACAQLDEGMCSRGKSLGKSCVSPAMTAQDQWQGHRKRRNLGDLIKCWVLCQVAGL